MKKLKSGVLSLTGWRRFVLASVLGALATAALPPVYVVVLLIPAFTGLIWLIDATKGARSAFAIGWWFGLGHFVSGVYWISISMLVKPDSYAWMIPFAVFGLPSVLAVFTAIAAVMTHKCRFGGFGRIVFLAAAWAIMEWVRSWIFTGFPWNLMATVWVAFDPMMQFAALGGAYGLSFLTVAVAAAPAALFGEGSRRNKAFVAVAFAVLGLVWLGGYVRLATASDAMVADVRLRLVQPNIDQKLKWKPELRRDHVAKQLGMSLSPPKAGALKPTHIIWAETATPFSLINEPKLLSAIGAAAPTGGLLITGAPRTSPRGEKPFKVWNSLHAITPKGEVAGSYNKFHLVPFGEYVPFREFLSFSKLTAGRGDFSPGTGVVTLDLPGLPPVSPLICYEVIFPGRVVDRENRPSWILNLTNDGWYGRSSGPYQHLAAARLRAVEEGLPLVRVANTGISAVVDAYGRIRASLGLGLEGVVDSGLPVHLEQPTPYGRFGDWIVLPILFLIVTVGFLTPNDRQKDL